MKWKLISQYYFKINDLFKKLLFYNLNIIYNILYSNEISLLQLFTKMRYILSDYIVINWILILY